MLYTEQDYIEVNIQRKKLWIKLAAVTALFITGIVVFSIIRIDWPGYVIGILWAITVVFLWGMQGSRLRRYYLFLKDIKDGLEKEITGVVADVDQSITSKELVEFYTVIFNDDNANPESPSRKLYFDATKGVPSFKKGDKLKLILFGNNIKSFEKI